MFLRSLILAMSLAACGRSSVPAHDAGESGVRTPATKRLLSIFN